MGVPELDDPVDPLRGKSLSRRPFIFNILTTLWAVWLLLVPCVNPPLYQGSILLLAYRIRHLTLRVTSISDRPIFESIIGISITSDEVS
ncbi:hypothetical protein WOLCODRAFT_28783 [Wolfiporia cocos MD-104 SS10]|uniref:Uncharacterized protein n=1 Tax=Wolfiporia cocos (strain MD-104) TaxID=742152 RepID=A0A2H3J3M8_WOLCO|nr:hypothetical protein WOLCODRAFT_28783 [Wolfiporia cocos MD-104 SS10]